MPEITIGKFKFSLVKAITIISVVIGALVGIVEFVAFGVREYDNYSTLKKDFGKLKKEEVAKDSTIFSLRTELKTLKEFMNKKETSFAVGFRVMKDEDGKEVKGYRDWEGTTHILYYDAEMSNYYGVNSYFWVDEDGNKQHVW